uniref:Uncharacterized protein n=1 Tax=Parascaris equorum TaxID=6256 RepID=A0A914RJA6_PAREQ
MLIVKSPSAVPAVVMNLFVYQRRSRQIADLVRYSGKSLSEACDEVVFVELRQTMAGFIGVDRKGNVAMPFNTPGMFRVLLQDPGRQIQAQTDRNRRRPAGKRRQAETDGQTHSDIQTRSDADIEAYTQVDTDGQKDTDKPSADRHKYKQTHKKQIQKQA